MKTLFTLFLIGISLSINAQQNDKFWDSVRNAKPILERYDNLPKGSYGTETIMKKKIVVDSSTLVVIDNKFCYLNSAEYLQLDQSKIESMEVFKDKNSLLPIKNVIIIRLKKPKKD